MDKHHLCQWMSRRMLALLLIRGWEEQTRKHRPVWINETLRTTRTSSWSRISWIMLSSRLNIYGTVRVTSWSMCSLWSFQACRDWYTPVSHFTVALDRMEHLQENKTNTWTLSSTESPESSAQPDRRWHLLSDEEAELTRVPERVRI